MVLMMEQGTLLQHQLPIHSDYGSLSIDSEEQCGSSQSQDPYAQHTAADILRRDSALSHQLSGNFPFVASQQSNSGRFVAGRAVGDSPSYHTTGNFPESTSGSISTSPSSAASSSLAYTAYSPHYTSAGHFPGAVQLSQTFVPSTYSTPARSSSLLDTSVQSMLPPPNRSSQSNTLERESATLHATSTPYLARTTLPGGQYPTYASYPETPRTALLHNTAALTLSPNSPYANHHHMANSSSSTSQGYGATAADEPCIKFPWSELEVLEDLTCDGQLLTPLVNAKVEKGFFESREKMWTCYRRNYFSVNCSFELRPVTPNGRITIHRRGHSTPEQVQATGMRLSAAVDGPDGKNIELVQHTPKRDAGPKTKIEVFKIAPTVSPSGRADLTVHGGYPGYHASSSAQVAGPYLPLQQQNYESDTQAGASQDGSSSTSTYSYHSSAPPQPTFLPGQGTSHTFDRVQFKQATANNGKRRATQQFFHLIVELFVDVRKDGAEKAVWVKVAQKVSEKIVVRGRSPSHYSVDKLEGMHGSSARSSISGMAYGAPVGASFGALNSGGFRGLTNAYGSHAHGNNPFRRAELHYSDHGSQSDSSASSLEEGAMDSSYQSNDTAMPDAGRLALPDHEGYQYLSGAMYEHIPQHGSMLPPLAKLDNHLRYSGDVKPYNIKSEYHDTVAGAQFTPVVGNRFQDVESGRLYLGRF